MKIGDKLLKLRKTNNLSQEQLAEKLNVTRQTISNWELNETTPDIEQAKELSKIFNISLDELVDNDVKNILVEKVSNTEKLAGMIIKIIKFLGIAFLIMFIIGIVAFTPYHGVKKSNINDIENEILLVCSLENKEYHYSIKYDGNNEIISASGDQYIDDNVDTVKYSNALDLIEKIENYFIVNNGTCND